jgi:hypothetical protein
MRTRWDVTRRVGHGEQVDVVGLVRDGAQLMDCPPGQGEGPLPVGVYTAFAPVP